jgi:hypothetical protein
MAKGIYTPQRLIGKNAVSKKVYGSTKTGSSVNLIDSTDPVQIQPATLEDGVLGYTIQTGNNVKAPPREEEDSKNLGMSQNIQYLLQHLQQWRSDQDYHLDNQDTCLVGTSIYKSLINNNINYAPASNPSQWEYLSNLQLATDQEVFNKDNSKPITAENISNAVTLAKFSAGNSISGLTQNVAIGGTYNLLTSLVSTSEVQNGNIVIQYKNISNTVQNYILDDINNKFLFPSNLYTYNLLYNPYRIRVQVTYNIPTTTNQTTRFYIRLRRVIDNSVVPAGTLEFDITNTVARTGETADGVFETFVNSETDPFVLNGCYLSIDNDSISSDTITVTGVNIRIFRN